MPAKPLVHGKLKPGQHSDAYYLAHPDVVNPRAPGATGAPPPPPKNPGASNKAPGGASYVPFQVDPPELPPGAPMDAVPGGTGQSGTGVSVPGDQAPPMLPDNAGGLYVLSPDGQTVTHVDASGAVVGSEPNSSAWSFEAPNGNPGVASPTAAVKVSAVGVAGEGGTSMKTKLAVVAAALVVLLFLAKGR